MLERPVLLHGRGHRDGEMLDWNCGRRSSAVMDIDINIRQELVMLLSGSGYGGQQQQQQQVIKKSKACMNVELFAQRSSSTTTTTTTAATSLLQQQQQQQKEQQRPRQQLKPPEEVVACPRCQSLNTKFCYYNNYSLTQPRHFCKNCRRYWTAGGTLRNVPVGGGCRKIKRSSCKSSTTTYHHLHQHQHQQHTAAALAANSDHAAIIYDSPPPPPGHGFIAHHGILDTFNGDDNTHYAAAAAAVQWLQQQQQQHTPMSSFATILHHQSKDLELMRVPAAAAGLSSCIDEHRLLHDSQQQQQPLQESCSIMNRLGGLFHSVQQQHPDAAAVNSSCRHINASSQHDAAALCSSTVGLDDFQSSVNFVDNSSSRCTSRAEAGVCNYNIQLPSERRLVAAAHDRQGNTTTTTLIPSHNDNTNSRAAESWRVVLQMPKQEEQEQEEEEDITTTTLQSWPPVHEEHRTLQQAGSLDLNSFKQDHHVKAMKSFHAPSSLSLPSCTHRLGEEEEEEEEESKEAQCVEQHEHPGAAAPGASWQHYLYSSSQHHVAPGMPQCYEAVTAPPAAAAAAADTLGSFWSNPSWSHLDLHTLCESGPSATLL